MMIVYLSSEYSLSNCLFLLYSLCCVTKVENNVGEINPDLFGGICLNLGGIGFQIQTPA